MAALPEFRINRDASIRREAISEDYDCAIVDDFLQDPHQIVEFAARHAGEFSKPESGYPGQQVLVNDHAMSEIYRFIRFNMTQHFPFFRGGMKLWALLSMVTLKPDELGTLQRICHTDPIPGVARKSYAGLVYVFVNVELGGAGWYRWRKSASELRYQAAAIEREDPDKGLAFLQENFPTYRKHARYMTETNEIAELLCEIPARFNRLIFYSGQIPHSGAIKAPELLSNDIRQGRLTLNVFADVLPR